jgi:trimeric autotransporter adhesin
MKKIYKLLVFTLAFSIVLFAKSQVAGVKNIPTDYVTIEAAITALNANGVGAGGATINVPAGYTETPSTALVLSIFTNVPTAANPLVFKKIGAGANPLITAYTGTGTVDGIFILNGTDYVTIDGIDLQENVANTTATTQMEWGYALLKNGAANGSQNNTIKNCTVTLSNANVASVGIYVANHTILNTTSLTVTSFSGTNSKNKFYNNTIQNAYTGYSLNGFVATAPFDLYDQENQIGKDGISTRRSQVIAFGGGAATASGIATTNQNKIKVFGTYISNSGAPAHTSVLNGINLGSASNANADIYADTVTLNSSSASASALSGILNASGATGAGNTINIYDCVVENCTYATNTSGTFRAIQSSATASYTNIYNNKVNNNTMPGTGELSGIFYGGSSPTAVLNVNLNNNIVSNNTKTGTAGILYCIFASASTNTTNCFSNQMFNNSNANSSGATFGYYNFAFGYNENVYNNQIYNITGGSAEVTMLHVRSGSGPTNKQVYGNEIYNITANSTNIVSGVWLDYGTVSNIYKNKIYNITNTSTTGGTPALAGIQIGNNLNTQTNVYNNYVSDLKAPNATNTFACIMGIWFNGPTGSSANISHNTVYLNATGTGTNFGSSALYVGPNVSALDLRNNVLVNVSNTTGTGLNRAITRSNTSLGNYALSSGYNCVYAGTPSATNLLYYDLTNSAQTIEQFRAFVGPRDQSSFRELPAFVNVATAPYDLHLQTTLATQCEGGGLSIGLVTTDFDGNARNATTPDVGADEISGISTDIAAPNIQYNILGNSGIGANRTLSAFATITDQSGINTSAGTKPRLYYKKSTHANAYNSNTSGTDGWKYVEASNAVSPFDFNMNYAILFGGSVAAGDIIQYFVLAQDLNGTPRLGFNKGGFTTEPSSVNLAAANFPITHANIANNALNQFTIVANVYSGIVNVGPTEAITSLTNAGGLFALINAGALSGNLTANITGDLTAETGTNALNQWSEVGAGNYTLSIAPSSTALRNITGSNATNALIRFDGADRINIDGRFAGSGRFLRFLNTSNTTPTFGYINDAQNNTLQYCIIESGNSATTSNLGGTILIGTTTGLNGNDNNTINNCEIRDRSDVVGTSNFAINCVGTSAALTQYNDNITIANNDIHDWYLLNGSNQSAINLGTGNSAFTIIGNSFYHTATRTHAVSGASTRAITINFTSTVNSNGGHTITGNFIGGTAPGAAGGDLTLNVSGAGTSQTFIGILLSTGLIPNNVHNNTIRKIDFTTNVPTAATTIFSGINASQGLHLIGSAGGNTIGDTTVINSIKLTFNTGGAVSTFIAGIFCGSQAGYATIQNNTIAGISIAGTTASAVVPQWIQNQGTPSATSNISNNKIGSSLANSLSVNTAGASIMFGIRQTTTSGAALIATNNTIQNITDNTSNAGSSVFGTLVTSTVGSTYPITFTNNTIKNISSNALPSSAAFTTYGLSFQNLGGSSSTILNNTISNISNVNSGAGFAYVTGVQVQGATFGATMSKNRIYGLSNANTGASVGLAGVYLFSGNNWEISNNMIAITNGANTNPLDISGIYDGLAENSSIKAYYNSIYIGGTTSSGAYNSSAYNRQSNSLANFKNNLLYNTRTGGTGKAVAVVSANTFGSGVTNNNAYVVPDTAAIGLLNFTAYGLNAWKAAIGNDANTYATSTTNETPSAMFVNAAIGDLHVNTSNYPAGVGTPLAITDDFDGNARSATFPSAGADEVACVAPVVSLVSSTNALCNGASTGAATVSAINGASFTYSWSPSGGNASSASGLAAGTYTVTVTNNCNVSTNFNVVITQPAVLAPTVSKTDITCNNANNGTASVAVTGGTGAYTYAWSNGGTSASISALSAGTYTCIITDANACSKTDSAVIINPAVLASSISSQTNILCNGATTGTATVNTAGGTGAYTYAWSPSGGTAATASGFAAGSYTCTITDANGCSTAATANISQPSAITASSSSTVSSCTSNTGTATVSSVNGGVAPYTYSWSPSGATAATATGLGAGAYVCTITDSNACSITKNIVVTTASGPAVTAASQANPNCNGAANGSASVNTPVGGQAPFVIDWTPGNPTGDGTLSVTGLTAGTWTCSITDANSCNATVVFNITQPSIVTGSQTLAVCAGQTVTVGSSTYNASGTYTDTLTALGGCDSIVTTNLTVKAPVNIATTLSGTTITAIAAPATYQWINCTGNTTIATATSQSYIATANGNYAVIVTQNACTDTSACVSITSIGLEKVIATANTISIQPNPNNGEFVIRASKNMNSIKITDVFGKVIQVLQPSGLEIAIDIQGQAKGMYFVNVMTDGKQQIFKVVKE